MSVAELEGAVGGCVDHVSAVRGCVQDGIEESSVMASLIAMFPLLDHEVISTVLQSHDGGLEEAVEYLMAMCRAEVEAEGDVEKPREIKAYQEIHHEFEGQFSEDIGGLPELVPSFIFEPSEEEEDEDLSEDIGGPPEVVPSFVYQPTAEEVDEYDPLPTYEEACQPVGPALYPLPSVLPDREEVRGRREEARRQSVEASTTAIEEAVPPTAPARRTQVRGEGLQHGPQERDDPESMFEDSFVPSPSLPTSRHQRQRAQAPLEDDEDEDLTYGDHTKHWTRLGSPTDELSNSATGRRSNKKGRRRGGKLSLRRSSKGDYKSQQLRSEMSVGARSPPQPLRRLMDDGSDSQSD